MTKKLHLLLLLLLSAVVIISMSSCAYGEPSGNSPDNNSNSLEAQSQRSGPTTSENSDMQLDPDQASSALDYENPSASSPAPDTSSSQGEPSTSPFPEPGSGLGNEGPVVDAALADSILSLINSERIGAGLDPLIADDALIAGAIIRANEVLIDPSLGHSRPNGSNYETVFHEVGYASPNLLGENLVFAVATMSADDIITSWRDSSSHYDNYMNPDFVYCGLAIVIDTSQEYSLVGSHLFAG